MTAVSFSPEIYRSYNLDLRHLSDEEAAAHFAAFPGERRVHASTADTRSFLSMRWLRGNGVEIGAGSNPTPLFGNAVALVADCDRDLVFGGRHLDLHKSLDAADFAASGKIFDFAIASHVLEHVDSVLRSLENLISVTKVGGIVYVVFPDIEWLNDVRWIPEFDFGHHVAEYSETMVFAELHDTLYLDAVDWAAIENNEHAQISEEYRRALRARSIPQSMRFMHHKHNYTMQGWLDLVTAARGFLRNTFRVVDVRYGHERKDCHFVLEVLAGDPAPEPKAAVQSTLLERILRRAKGLATS
ncbi:methyltransferase domain-containing protein [Variovorax sp. tm]|uniref:methyltransferase domain-containing protein n=1 Tax=Variovorax atrisoli TaxID=3394203 RepID=UPI003A813A01